jgi:hypothetical protein
MRLKDVCSDLHKASRELSSVSGLTITAGYLGNCSDSYDERYWYAWVMNARGGNKMHPNNLTHLGHGPFATSVLDKMLDYMNTDSLVEALSRDGVYAVHVNNGGVGDPTTAEESQRLIDNFLRRFG